jgi:hypothetical protein
MTDDERPAFAQALVLLAETLAEPISELRGEGYWLALRDRPLVDVLTAFRLLLQTARFFPKPADVRIAIDGPIEDRAELAWIEAMHAAASGTAKHLPARDEDAVLWAGIDAFGGWRWFCECPDSPTARAKLFRGAYMAEARAAERTDCAERLELEAGQTRVALPRHE